MAAAFIAGMLAAAVTAKAVAPGEFRFRENGWQSYVEASDTATPEGWMALARAGSSNSFRWLCSSTLLVKLKEGASAQDFVGASALQAPESLSGGWWKLQAFSPREALVLAEWLSQNDAVLAVHPNMRRPVRLHGAYAPAPNDRYYTNAIHLENRNADGSRAGVDLNIREAWAVTRGEGVVVGVVDDGIELGHPDLIANTAGQPHYNFVASNTNALPQASGDNHGTAVSGLIAAVGGNGIGVVGAAPAAKLTAMKIFLGGNFAVDDLTMFNVFTYRNGSIWVQNHSWGYTGNQQLLPAQLELDGMTNAALGGRGGKGIVLVRSAGNEREFSGDSNNDGYQTVPHSISVAAVKQNGRFTTYSSQGANVLVSTVSGDDDSPKLPTTDRIGSLGFNSFNPGDGSADYGVGSTGFSGTSAAAPQISGLVALLLSANTNLAWRDVQQILVLSSRHYDLTDPSLMTNGAGLLVSHNDGYGVPDSGYALELASGWSNRPPAASFTVVSNFAQVIPDDGLRVVVPNAPSGTISFGMAPSLGAQADAPTPTVPFVYVGGAQTPLTTNLTGKAALIERGGNFFEEKIRFAADAGALFAIVFNNIGTTERITMAATEYSRIPAGFMGRNDGLELVNLLSTNALVARLAPTNASVVFNVTNSLVCEHVQVRVQTSHTRRGDLRITLRSPSGTLSVLQARNEDGTAGPSDWTYLSTQHFFEPTKGNWTLGVTDENPNATGSLFAAALVLHGVPIIDTDGDGLDDGWEMQWFGNLNQTGLGDPDGDGENNLIEQVRQTDPTKVNRPWKLDLSQWTPTIGRLSWPGNGRSNVLVDVSGNLPGFTNLTNRPSRFPNNELFVPLTNSPGQFFRLRPAAP